MLQNNWIKLKVFDLQIKITHLYDIVYGFWDQDLDMLFVIATYMRLQ